MEDPTHGISEEEPRRCSNFVDASDIRRKPEPKRLRKTKEIIPSIYRTPGLLKHVYGLFKSIVKNHFAEYRTVCASAEVLLPESSLKVNQNDAKSAQNVL
jgi:hypothetical protein